MGYRLESDTVRKIAMELMCESNGWEFGGIDDMSYIKAVMYNTGVQEMANKVIEAIEELKKA